MAYTYDQVEYDLGSVTATTTGDKLGWSPGYVPHYIRAAAVQVSVKETANKVKLTFSTASAWDTVASEGDIAAIVVSTDDAKGQVVYSDGLSEKLIKPGQRLVVRVTTAGSALACNVKLFVEPSFDTPANVGSGMRATT